MKSKLVKVTTAPAVKLQTSDGLIGADWFSIKFAVKLEALLFKVAFFKSKLRMHLQMQT